MRARRGALDNLRGDVGQRTRDRLGFARQERGCQGRARDAEIGQQRLTVRRDDDVLRLHIVVDHALPVSVRKRPRDSQRVPHRFVWLQRAGFEQFAQRTAVHEFEHQVGFAVDRGEVVGLHDVGVPQTGEDSRLAGERPAIAPAKRLQSDATPEDGVCGEHDTAEPALPKFPLEGIARRCGPSRHLMNRTPVGLSKS